LVPALVGAAIVVVLAFVAGRMSAGDGGNEVSATPTKAVGTTTSTRTQTHTVAQGESLLAIASRYGVTLDELAAANGITNTNRVFVGQVLTIPPPTIVSTLPVASTTTSTTRAKK
jgi:peptidoglycan-N-acetylglucosamine deacetylase